MGRHTGFGFTVDASPARVAVLARHGGAARFAYNQCLALVRPASAARAVDGSVVVPWSGFDLINAFSGWKRSAAAGRVTAVDPAGHFQVVATGLAWRAVCQQLFEEAAVALARGLAAYTTPGGAKGPVPGSVSLGQTQDRDGGLVPDPAEDRPRAGRDPGG
jgi:putative transposase